ncbi:MAG: hypothetical protein GX051_02570 [Clostridiales bacterium]|jgi:hypothetical protein|nr:hypothetical protein [Clostridiales bacterium]
MIDWNGNGKIDPVDVGISIGVESSQEGDKKPTKRTGCLTSVLITLSILALILIWLL